MSQPEERLFTPGPTPLPPSVREILARPILHHRTAEFQTVLARVTAGLMRLFRTQQPVITLAGSGTSGLEALVVNLCSPGETVAVLNAGKFGERWTKIARAYGLTVVEHTERWGAAFDPEKVAAFLDGEAAGAGIVFLTHSETSTGVLNDLPTLTALARDRGKLVVADVVTSFGVHEIDFDAWGLAAAVTGSQKGLMLPPGAAFVTLSEAAWARSEKAGLPRFSLDLGTARSNLEKNSTPFTPPVPLVCAVEEAVRLIEAEGPEAVYARHARHASACRAAVKALGLEMFTDSPSNGLTAVRAPEGRDGQEVVKELRERRGFRIAGGQAPMKGKLFRLGHMGWYTDADIRDLIAALEDTLTEMGWVEGTDARSAADAVLAEAVG